VRFILPIRWDYNRLDGVQIWDNRLDLDGGRGKHIVRFACVPVKGRFIRIAVDKENFLRVARVLDFRASSWVINFSKNFCIRSQPSYRCPVTHEGRGGGWRVRLVWDAMNAPARSSSASADLSLLILSFSESVTAVGSVGAVGRLGIAGSDGPGNETLFGASLAEALYHRMPLPSRQMMPSNYFVSFGNMSSGTYMLEGEAKSVCGPKLTDQIVFKGRVR
jgi:hypothetical protein